MTEKAVLFSEMTPDHKWEPEFNDWYDREHIPIRMDVAGFVGAQRYRREDRNYLTVYDLDDTGVLATTAYVKVKSEPSARTAWMLSSVSGFSRYVGRPIGQQINEAVADFLCAPMLYSVFFAVPEHRIEEFDEWYNRDHVPTLLQCPDWLACRRFEIQLADPHPYNRLALHYLGTQKALNSGARSRAQRSEWRSRLAEEDWFRASYQVFERHGSRFGKGFG